MFQDDGAVAYPSIEEPNALFLYVQILFMTVMVCSHEEWEVGEILRSRWRDRKHKKNKQYLVKWKGYGAEHNEWVPADDLRNSRQHRPYRPPRGVNLKNPF
jgi:hypothetical protein